MDNHLLTEADLASVPRRVEDLPEDLRPYGWMQPTLGLCLSHRFHSGAVGVSVDRLRESITGLEAHFNEKVAAGAWEAALFTAARTHVPDVLANVLEPLIPRTHAGDGRFWRLAASAWSDAEDPSRAPGVWAAIFESDRRHQGLMMTRDERRELAALPDPFPIWRGVAALDADRAEDAADARSWTLDRDKAEWFARRGAFGGRLPFVLHAHVPKFDVFALLNGRDEREILLLDDAAWTLDLDEVRAL